jgi:hypothetical protein
MPDRRPTAIAAAAVAAACVGCCSIPLLAGATVFGVALCSARFLGLAAAAAVLVGGFGLLVMRARRRRRPHPVPVELGATKAVAVTPSAPSEAQP